MRTLRVENATRGRAVGDSIAHADGWWARLRGLLGRPSLGDGEGMLLSPCSSIHMIGMQFAVDVAFLDAKGRVIAAHPDLRPGFRSRSCLGARHVLELPAGTLGASGTTEGDTLLWAAAEAAIPQSLAS